MAGIKKRLDSSKENLNPPLKISSYNIFLIFTAFSQYQWVVSLQLGYFISQQFTWKSSGKKTFYCESFFPCGKWDFSTRKKAFTAKVFFPFDFQMNCSEIKYPSCKEINHWYWEKAVKIKKIIFLSWEILKGRSFTIWILGQDFPL